MRSAVLAVLFGLGGCMTAEPIDSTTSAIVEGDWVMAPSISDRPMQAAQVPEGVEAIAVDLVLTSDGILLACNNGVPMGGYDPTDDGDDEGGDNPIGLAPEHNAPARLDDGADEAGSSGTTASDLVEQGELYDDHSPVVDIDAMPLPENVWLFHAGCL